MLKIVFFSSFFLRALSVCSVFGHQKEIQRWLFAIVVDFVVVDGCRSLGVNNEANQSLEQDGGPQRLNRPCKVFGTNQTETFSKPTDDVHCAPNICLQLVIWCASRKISHDQETSQDTAKSFDPSSPRLNFFKLNTLYTLRCLCII